jgi:uncharacterized membrane protein
MKLLVGGLAVFLVLHLLPTRPALRMRLVSTLGTPAYRILFSIVSIASFVAIIYGFAATHGLGRATPQLWVSPTWGKHLTMALMIPAMVLLVAAYVPSRLRTRVAHPMLLAIILWAAAHLLANADLAGVLLFTSFLAYAVYDLVSATGRSALGPLGQSSGGILQDAIAVIAGLGLYAFMLFWGHAKLIGVPLLP